MRHLLLLSGLVISGLLFSQSGKTDSLLAQLKKLPEDTNKVNTLNLIAVNYKLIDPAKAVTYADQAIVLAGKIHFDYGRRIAFQNKAQALSMNGRFDEAFIVYDTAIAEALRDSNIRSVSILYNRKGFAYLNSGRSSEAIEGFKAGAVIANKSSNYDVASEAYRSLGMAYASIGEHSLATENFHKAIDLAEKVGDKQKLGFAYIAMGNSRQAQGDTVNALESFTKALVVLQKANYDYGVAGCYISIGNIYLEQKKYQKALENYYLCLEIRTRIEDNSGISAIKANIGNVLVEQGKPEEALPYYNEALPFFQKNNDYNGVAGTLNYLAKANSKLGRFDEAEKYAKESIGISGKYKYKNWLQECYAVLADIYFKTGKYREAYLYRDSSVTIEKEIIGEEHAAQAKELEAKYQNRKNEEKIANLNALTEKQELVKEKQQQIIIAVSVGLILVIILLFFLGRINSERKKANLTLADQNKLIAEKNKDITDSINYALRIQKSVMPDEKILQKNVNDYFIFNKPRDIVSGDFYWLATKGDLTYIAVADCTGHGVPGALVSVVGINMLNKIIEQPGIFSTSEILEKLHTLVIAALNKDSSARESNDGMDIGLLAINQKSGKAFFAGAGRPLYYTNSKGLQLLKGDRFSVAGEKKETDAPFSEQELILSGKTNFYLSSDGFVDQFGEQSGKKYLSKRFQEFLQSISDFPMKEQQTKIEHEFHSWKGKLEQVDDVMVVGIQVG